MSAFPSLKAEVGAFESSCRYLHWAYFALAVLDVYQENEANEPVNKVKASADTWVTHSRLRNEVFRRTVARWTAWCGFDDTYFPYSENGVARMYLRFRKRNSAELDKFRAEVMRVKP